MKTYEQVMHAHEAANLYRLLIALKHLCGDTK